MNVLVTGTGTVGSGFLSLKDHEVWSCNRTGGHKTYTVDLTDENWVKDLFARYKPDIIYHTAGLANPRSNENDLFRVNVQGTMNLVKHCPPCRFYHMSSIVVYNMDNSTEFDRLHPRSLYGITKLTSEQIVRYYGLLRDLRITIVRLGAVVGPVLRHGLLFDIIKKLKSDSEFLELWGKPPGSSKTYTHIDDVVRITNQLPEGTYNVCNETVLSVEEVAKLAMDTLNIHKEIKWSNQETFGDNKFLSASNQLIKSLRLNVEISPSDAIRRSCEYFK